MGTLYGAAPCMLLSCNTFDFLAKINLKRSIKVAGGWHGAETANQSPHFELTQRIAIAPCHPRLAFISKWQSMYRVYCNREG